MRRKWTSPELPNQSGQTCSGPALDLDRKIHRTGPVSGSEPVPGFPESRDPAIRWNGTVGASGFLPDWLTQNETSNQE